jgi:hypothetical protein
MNSKEILLKKVRPLRSDIKLELFERSDPLLSDKSMHYVIKKGGD